jgi:hypothetical protein
MAVTRKDVEGAIAGATTNKDGRDNGDGVIVVRADNLKTVGHRPPADQNSDAVLPLVGQASMEDLRRVGIDRVAIRPDNRSGSKGEPEAEELAWLTPPARREVQGQRNKYGDAAKAERSERAEGVAEATSAAHGESCPVAGDQAPEAPTRPDDGPGSVRGI